MQYKEEDAGGLAPGKDDDVVVRKNSRKDVTLLDGLDYKPAPLFQSIIRQHINCISVGV